MNLYPETLAFYAAAVPAVLLVGLSKGGFQGLSVLSLPLLSLATQPLRAAAIMLPILIVQDAVSVWSFRKSFDRRNLAIMLPGALGGFVAGALLATQTPDAAIKLMVGLIASGFVVREWLKGKTDAAEPQPARVGPGLFWGAISGFTSFIANAGAPPAQVYLLPQRMEPIMLAGTVTMFFATMNLIKFGIFIALGQVHADNLAISAGLFPPAIAATFAGVWLVRRVQSKVFYKIVFTLTFVVGLKLIFDGARGLI